MNDTIKRLLQEEPLRALAAAAALVVWIVASIAQLVGFTRIPPVDFLGAMTAATAAAGAVAEFARRLVYSPATVAQIVAQTPPGAKAETSAAVLEGAPPAVQPKDLPGGGA